MQNIDTEEALVQKVGGKFKLTTLMQKRLVELNRGAAPLVELGHDEDARPRDIVVQEILEGKIELAPRGEIEAPLQRPEEVPTEAEAPASDAAPATTSDDAAEDGGEEIYGSDIKKIKEQRIKELSQLLNPKK